MDETNVKNLIATYIEATKKNKIFLKYNLNILDEIHANENAHTRILLRILDYINDNGQKIFLKYFIDMLNTTLTSSISITGNELNCCDISGQFAFIDGYITTENSAIIIENKINNAIDQYHQLENYINTSKMKYEKSHIYVVYLTENGSKKPSEDSLTKNAKEWLGYESENKKGRFIEINYRDHILNFLDRCLKEIYTSDATDEEILSSALIQYKNYLEGRFGMRKNEIEYNEKMDEDILQALELKSESPLKRFDEIEKIKNEMINTLDRIKFAPRRTLAEQIIEYYKNTEYIKLFDEPIIWIDNIRTLILVFPNFEFQNDKYKLDVNISFDSFILKVKRADNKDLSNIELCNIFKTLGFNELYEKKVEDNKFESTGCDLKTELDNLFKVLKEAQYKKSQV